MKINNFNLSFKFYMKIKNKSFIFLIILCVNFTSNSFAEKLSNDKVVVKTIDIFPKIKKAEMPASMQINNITKLGNKTHKKIIKENFLTNKDLTIDLSTQNIVEQDEIRFNFEKYLITKTKNTKRVK